MSGDILQFLVDQRLEILREKERLQLVEKLLEENKENVAQKLNDEESPTKKLIRGSSTKQAEASFCCNRADLQDSPNRGKEEEENVNENVKRSGNFPWHSEENRVGEPSEGVLKCVDYGASKEDQRGDSSKFENVPSIVEPLDLGRCYDISLEERKQALIDRPANSEGLFSHGSSDEAAGLNVLGGGAPFGLPLLRRGEYAPSRHARLRAAPHVGLGEYELGRGQEARKYLSRDQYLRHLAAKNKQSSVKETLSEIVTNQDSPKSDSSTNTEHSIESKSVQTDIENINSELVVKYDPLYQAFGAAAAASNDAVSSRRRRTATDELVDAALLRKRSPSASAYKRHRHNVFDQRLTTAQNEQLLRAETNATAMDKPKSILSNRRTGSPRDRYSSDLGHTSYGSTNFMDGFSYSDRTDDLERERLKRESYQHELRMQIEEKRHLAALRDEQERRERELENRRLEQQLMRMRDEQVQEDQRRQKRNELMRRHSDDLLRRKTELHELQRPWRRHADSESANLDSLGLGTSPSAAGYLGGGGSYSPPVSRRTPLVPVSPYSPSAASYNVPATSVFPDSSSTSRYNSSRFDSSLYPGSGGVLRKPTESSALRRMESMNSYDTMPLTRSGGLRSKFDRFDSLSRIDSLSHRLETMSVRDGYVGGSDLLTDVQRRHSATQQDLSISRSPRLRRRNSSSRFDETLPIPILKARSPVAKELRNAVPFSSHRSSDSHRRLEDKWQIPAVQKNILHPTSLDSPTGYSSRAGGGSILTQLGSIRAQLQREQLRMDETLRRRGLLRTRTTEDY